MFPRRLVKMKKESVLTTFLDFDKNYLRCEFFSDIVNS